MERYRNVGGVQGGVEYAQMDTDVETFTINDIGNALESGLKQYKDYKDNEAKRQAEALEREYYLQSQAIELSDMGSAEKEDAHFQLDKKYMSMGLKTSSAISTRNFMGTSPKDMLTYQTEQEVIKESSKDEAERTKRFAEIGAEVMPFLKNASFEERVNGGKKVIAAKEAINGYKTVLKIPDKDVQDGAVKEITSTLGEIIRYKVFELASSNAAPAAYHNLAAEVAPQVQTILGDDVEPYVVQNITNSVIKDVLDPVIEQAKKANEFSDVTRESWMRNLGDPYFRGLPLETQSVIAASNLYGLDPSFKEAVKDLIEKNGPSSLPNIQPVQEGKSMSGSAGYIYVSKPGAFPTGVALSKEGKQIGVQNTVLNSENKDMSTSGSKKSATAFNKDRQMSEGFNSLPTERQKELRAMWIKANAPVLAEMAVATFGDEMDTTGTDLVAGPGWTTEQGTRERFYDKLNEESRKYVASFNESYMFTNDNHHQELQDAVTTEMVKILNERGKKPKSAPVELLQRITRTLFGYERRPRKVKRFGKENAISKFLAGED